MHRLRIVVPRYGTEVVGGAERLAARLAHSLTSSGWRVEILTTCAVDERTWANALPLGTAVEDAVTVRRFAVGRERDPQRFHTLSRMVFRLPARARPEALWIRAQGPIAPALTTALAREEPQPTVFLPYLYHPTLVGLPRSRGPRILIPAAHDELPLRLRAVRRMIAASDACWYSTPEERELLERVHPVARARPAEIGTVGLDLPEGVDEERFRRRFGIEGQYLIYAGRDAPGKGVDELVQAMSEVRRRRPQTLLVLIGGAGTALGAQPGVAALGLIHDNDRWDAFAGAAAVIVPSPLESLSLVALEAWAVARPVLANAASPAVAGQVRRSGGGMAYRGREEFADMATSLLADPGRQAALGGAGQSFVSREYRWERVHERLQRLIDAASHRWALRG